MCGRYSIYANKEDLEERFHANMSDEEEYRAHFNAAPSLFLPVISNDNPKEIIAAKWGFRPHWADEKSSIRPQINARAETVSEKPFFRDSFKNRRCLILSNGFFEWDRRGPRKIPYRIAMEDDEPFAFAGIWDEAIHNGKKIKTFAIITTEANELISKIHNRMPVILTEKNEKDWLGNDLKSSDAKKILSPISSKLVKMYEVSSMVNSTRNNRSEIILPKSNSK